MAAGMPRVGRGRMREGRALDAKGAIALSAFLADTVKRGREMRRNQTGEVKVRLQPTARAGYTKQFPLGAGEDVWGLGFQISAPAHADPSRRRPGSMSWAGINNTFFWIDPCAQVVVVVLMQLLPFYDEAALAVMNGVEERVYKHLRD